MQILGYRVQVRGKKIRLFDFLAPDTWNLALDSRGVTTLLVVAFMGIFLIIMGAITSYSFEQAKYGRVLLGREQALHVA